MIWIRRPDCTAAEGSGAVNLPCKRRAQSLYSWLDEAVSTICKGMARMVICISGMFLVQPKFAGRQP